MGKFKNPFTNDNERSLRLSLSNFNIIQQVRLHPVNEYLCFTPYQVNTHLMPTQYQKNNNFINIHE